MIEGACHCGTVHWRVGAGPDFAKACNCSLCARYGALWVYGHENEDVSVSGPTTAYAHGEKSLAFHFCAGCGCIAYWRSLSTDAAGRRRLAVNIRLAQPESVADIPVQRFDGRHSWTNLPRDGRRVGDVWF